MTIPEFREKFDSMTLPELIFLLEKTLDENSKLTEQAYKHLEIINKIHFLEQIYE